MRAPGAPQRPPHGRGPCQPCPVSLKTLACPGDHRPAPPLPTSSPGRPVPFHQGFQVTSRDTEQVPVSAAPAPDWLHSPRPRNRRLGGGRCPHPTPHRALHACRPGWVKFGLCPGETGILDSVPQATLRRGCDGRPQRPAPQPTVRRPARALRATGCAGRGRASVRRTAGCLCARGRPPCSTRAAPGVHL